MMDSDSLPMVPSSTVITPALQAMKDRSAIRRKLLAQTLGVNSPNELPSVLGNTEDQAKRQQNKRGVDLSHLNEFPAHSYVVGNSGGSESGRSTGAAIMSSPDTSGNDNIDGKALVIAKRVSDSRDNEPKAKRRRTTDQMSVKSDETIMEPFDDYFQVLQEEEKVYRGSATFLKGTQSANPHNDYCQHFIDTGQRPQNFIRDSGLAERFDEYPKLKELITLKDELVASTASPPMYLKCDLRTYDLRDVGSRFDVILIEPPLEEYHISGRDCWSWEQIESLDIAAVADTRAFIWLWCGSTPESLQRGRNCLKRWGFRRCEDICWVKTNKSNTNEQQQQSGVMRYGAGNLASGNSLLQRTKEHCLMGIKGTVRRSTDGDFIHANVDIDLIITEEPPPGSIEKPLEMVLIAEHFCLGRRRLHLFGRDDTVRPGWLTVGPELTSSNFDPNQYRKHFDRQSVGPGITTGCTDRIEMLRPKSPVPMDKRTGGGGMMANHAGGNMSSTGKGGNASWQRTGDTRNWNRGSTSGQRYSRGRDDQRRFSSSSSNDRGSDRRRFSSPSADRGNGYRPFGSSGGGGRTGASTSHHQQGRISHSSTRQFGSHRRVTHQPYYDRGRERHSNFSRSGTTRKRF